jgi:hypothetical protein
MGPLSPSGEGKHYTPERQSFAHPTRVTNATTDGTLSLKALWANSAIRPGCMDAFSLASKGCGC